MDADVPERPVGQAGGSQDDPPDRADDERRQHIRDEEDRPDQSPAAEGLVAVEHASRVSLPDEAAPLRLWKRRRHGDTTLSIYHRA